MQLSLRRWNGPTGESQGHWLVRELPGIALIKLPQGWRVKQVYLKELSPLWPEEAEGPSEDELKKRGLSGPGGETLFFQTRSEALIALQQVISPDQAEGLGEALCE